MHINNFKLKHVSGSFQGHSRHFYFQNWAMVQTRLIAERNGRNVGLASVYGAYTFLKFRP